jgi:hypothetical protein
MVRVPRDFEELCEELCWIALAVERIAEHLAAPKPLADTDEVLARYGLTRAELEADGDGGR